MPRRIRSLAPLLLALALFGCADHLRNARVRGAEDFECRRDEVQAVAVDEAEGIFVVRGCDQVAAYRCATNIENGCKKLNEKATAKAIAMAPEPASEDGEAPKKKKKKAKDEGDEKGAGDEKGSGEKAKEEESAKASDAAETKPKDEAKDEGSSKKKKKKKSEDE